MAMAVVPTQPMVRGWTDGASGDRRAPTVPGPSPDVTPSCCETEAGAREEVNTTRPFGA
jgi:hypothetical protein